MFRKRSPLLTWHQSAPAAPPQRGHARLHTELLEPRLLMASDTSHVTFDVSNAEVMDALGVPGYSIQLSAPQASVELPGDILNERALRSWIRRLADEQYGELFGTTYDRNWFSYGYYCFCDDLDVSQPIPLLGSTNDFIDLRVSNAMAADATNVQVQGVDEADLVEADGERLFVLRSDELLIFRANGVDELALLSRVKLEAPASRMFLHGDRLAIVSVSGGYSGYLYGQNSHTTVTIMDVADESAPALVQKTEVPGRLVDLRAIDGIIVLITANQPQRIYLPALQSRATGGRGMSIPEQAPPVWSSNTASVDLVVNNKLGAWPSFSPATLTYQYETRQEYLNRIEDEVIGKLLLSYRSFDVDGNVIQRVSLVDSFSDMRAWLRGDSGDRLVVSSFDMHADSPGAVDTQLMSGSANALVYATKESIYLFSQDSSNYNRSTNIVKLTFDALKGQIKFAARGTLAGRLLNQFAANERDGVLRVVMTDTNRWPRSGQAVYTLREQGDRLKVVGELTGIAPNELLHSVSFQENEAHFVTYRKVDPLFVVNLSNPKKPTITGELKIPGYSELLINIDEDHLLGIGRGASRGFFAEMQLSIFDVTDPTNPTRSHLYSLEGGRNTSTEATGGRWTNGDGDHHAVTFLPEEGLLALPVMNEPASWGALQNGQLFSEGGGGLLLFRIHPTNGIQHITTVQHDTMIRRTVQVGDRLYAVSSSAITAIDINNPVVEVEEHAIQDALPESYTPLFQYVSANSYGMALELFALHEQPSVLTIREAHNVDVRPGGTSDQDDLALLLAVAQTSLSPDRVDPFEIAMSELCCDTDVASLASCENLAISIASPLNEELASPL